MNNKLLTSLREKGDQHNTLAKEAKSDDDHECNTALAAVYYKTARMIAEVEDLYGGSDNALDSGIHTVRDGSSIGGNG